MSDVKLGDGPSAGRRGSTGSTGPTGPTGPAGSDAPSGLPAYGYAVGADSTTITADSTVNFDLGGTPFPNVGFQQVPEPGGTSFIIAADGGGDYEYDFYIAGTPENPSANKSLQFVITVDGVDQVPEHAFRSGTSADSGDVLVCRGQGIIALTAGQTVILNNRTRAGLDSVSVTATAPGGGAGANRTFSLKKLN